jgi:hypothetical protein
MPDLCQSIRIPSALAAYDRQRHSHRLRGYLMLRPELCFWLCLLSPYRWTVSLLYVLVLDKNTRPMLITATPGFLRAGVSRANFVNHRPLSSYALYSYAATWTGRSSCLGFLLRRDSWHPQQLCILSSLI